MNYQDAPMFSFRTFSALFALFTILALSQQPCLAVPPPAKEGPALRTKEDRVAFLVWFRERYPELFRNKLDYDVRLLALLKDQNKVAEQLQLDPEYEPAFGLLKSNDYLEILITPKTENRIQYETRIRPAAFRAWRQTLIDTYQRLTLTHSPHDSLISVVAAEIKKIESEQDAVLYSETLATLLLRLTQEAQTTRPLPEEFGTQSVLGRIRLLKEPGQLEGKVVNIKSLIQKGHLNEIGFNADRSYSAQEVLALLVRNAEIMVKHEELENSVIHLFTLAVALLGEDPAQQNVTLGQQREVLDGLRVDVLNSILDRNVVKKRVEIVGKFKNSGPAVERIWKNAKGVAKDTERLPVNAKRIRLEEVPPLFGSLRALSGSDCSSKFSFPFPNHPAERVFFVSDPDTNSIKGYVSTRLVETQASPDIGQGVDGLPSIGQEDQTVERKQPRRVLYVHTIQGPWISDLYVVSILQGLHEKREALGADAVALPTSDNIGSIINRESIRKVLQNQIKDQPLHKINYLYPRLSSQIETFGSSFNTQNEHLNFDHQARNSEVHFYEPKGEGLSHVAVNTFPSPLVELGQTWPVPSRLRLMDFILDLQRHHRTGQLRPFLKVAGVSWMDWEAFVKSLDNPNALPVGKFLTEIRRLALKLQLDPEEVIVHRKELIGLGYLKAPDGINESTVDAVSPVLAAMMKEEVEYTSTNDLFLKNSKILLPTGATASAKVESAWVKKFPHLQALKDLASQGTDHSLNLYTRLLKGTGVNLFGSILLGYLTSKDAVVASAAQAAFEAVGDTSRRAQSEAMSCWLAAGNCTSYRTNTYAFLSQKNPEFLRDLAVGRVARTDGNIPKMAQALLHYLFEVQFESRGHDAAPELVVPEGLALDTDIAEFTNFLITQKEVPINRLLDLRELVRTILAHQGDPVIEFLNEKIRSSKLQDWKRAYFIYGLSGAFSPKRFSLLLDELASKDLSQKKPAIEGLSLMLPLAPNGVWNSSEALGLLRKAIHHFHYYSLKKDPQYKIYEGIWGFLGFGTIPPENLKLQKRYHQALKIAAMNALKVRLGRNDRDPETLEFLKSMTDAARSLGRITVRELYAQSVNDPEYQVPEILNGVQLISQFKAEAEGPMGAGADEAFRSPYGLASTNHWEVAFRHVSSEINRKSLSELQKWESWKNLLSVALSHGALPLIWDVLALLPSDLRKTVQESLWRIPFERALIKLEPYTWLGEKDAKYDRYRTVDPMVLAIRLALAMNGRPALEEMQRIISFLGDEHEDVVFMKHQIKYALEIVNDELGGPLSDTRYFGTDGLRAFIDDLDRAKGDLNALGELIGKGADLGYLLPCLAAIHDLKRPEHRKKAILFLTERFQIVGSDFDALTISWFLVRAPQEFGFQWESQDDAELEPAFWNLSSYPWRRIKFDRYFDLWKSSAMPPRDREYREDKRIVLRASEKFSLFEKWRKAIRTVLPQELSELERYRMFQQNQWEQVCKE